MNWNDNALIILLGGTEYRLSLLSILVFVVTFLIAVSALTWIGRRFRSGGTGCRWRRVSADDRPPFRKWLCRTCAAEAFSTDRRPPKECKKALKSVV